jgi:hypothetical protein
MSGLAFMCQKSIVFRFAMLLLLHSLSKLEFKNARQEKISCHGIVMRYNKVSLSSVGDVLRY